MASQIMIGNDQQDLDANPESTTYQNISLHRSSLRYKVCGSFREV